MNQVANQCTCGTRPWNPLQPFAHRDDCPVAVARQVAVERPPTTATIATTWDDIKELFHELWGNNAGGKYDKDTWKKLQQRLERLERATETLSPAARTGLIDSLRRYDSP